MSQRRDDTLYSKLQKELELSTFLNKGVLQSNEEQKIRIIELEKQNKALLIAEGQLSTTEDELEAVRKELKDLQDTARKSQRSWQNDMQVEVKAREKAEDERDEWKRRFEMLRAGFEIQRKAFEEADDIASGEEPERPNTRKGVARSTSKRKLNLNEASHRLSSPDPILLQTSQSRRKRRIASISSDEEQEEEVEEHPKRSNAAARTPTSHKTRNAPTPKVEPQLASSTSRRRSGGRVSDVQKVKVEREVSPETLYRDYSDNDPLAMD